VSKGRRAFQRMVLSGILHTANVIFFSSVGSVNDGYSLLHFRRSALAAGGSTGSPPVTASTTPARLGTCSVAAMVVMVEWGCDRGTDWTQARASSPAPQQSTAPTYEHRSRASSSCPSLYVGIVVGQVSSSTLNEASGLAVSRKNPGVLFSHNDAGDVPRLFAMTVNGRDLGTYHLHKAKSIDWEDLATGPTGRQGEWYIYVGDIGANGKIRRDIVVYRLLEPTVALDQEPKKRTLRDVERFDFTYPTRDVPDAETLMVDPRTGDLFLVTKPHNSSPKVYRARAPLDAKRPQILEEVATLPVFDSGNRRSRLVTSGDISPDGTMVLIRSYTTAYIWMRRDGESVAECVRREPCPVPLSLNRHGEAIAFSPNGQSYYTVSEGLEPEILRFDRRP